MCDGQNHSLKEVFRSSYWDCDYIVNWCSDCGAVVVDGEVDGRVLPGHFRKMQFPKLAQERYVKKS